MSEAATIREYLDNNAIALSGVDSINESLEIIYEWTLPGKNEDKKVLVVHANKNGAYSYKIAEDGSKNIKEGKFETLEELEDIHSELRSMS